MDLTLREAATLLGRNPRTLRAQLARGEIHGYKKGSRWKIPRHALPMTEEQREALEHRRRATHDMVDDVGRGPRTRRHPRSVLDLDLFQSTCTLYREMANTQDGQSENLAATAALKQALLSLTLAVHEFARERKARAFRAARVSLCRSLSQLLLQQDQDTEHARWASRIEADLLPSLSGLLQWSERDGRARR